MDLFSYKPIKTAEPVYHNLCAGVNDELTEIKTRSAPLMAESMSVEKNRFLPLHDSTTSFSPGWFGRRSGKTRQGGCVSERAEQPLYNQLQMNYERLAFTLVMIM